LSRAYGWTPQEINQMTLFQICYSIGVPTYEGMSEAMPMQIPIQQARAMGLING
jgi:hypothetical protein